MNEIKEYTPGSWKVDCPYIRGAGRAIASLESGRNEGEDAANARLIAAAPELYGALRDIYAALVIEEISTETRTRARLRARDALALVRVSEEERG